MQRPLSSSLALALLVVACGDDGPSEDVVKDPDEAPRVTVDRFSGSAATLMVRDGANGLPLANAPIDFDQGPFITQGFGPTGQIVKYYNFDVRSTTPAPIYALFREGEDTPVEGQLNIIDVVPGDEGYNDFWRVTKVTVPSDYQANTLASLAEIEEAGYPMEPTDALVNCPIVPAGSTATLRGGDESATLHRGWYRGQVASYFTFEERPLAAPTGSVPVSPISVTFNVNPDQPGGGPPSGFVVETGSMQTHNVLATIPSSDAYSPLWSVNVYDNRDFATVMDASSAAQANILATAVMNVNCPVVSVE